MEPKDYIQRLNEISIKKSALIEELRLFTQNQNEAIRTGRYDDLERLLDDRKLRMDAVDKLDEQFLVYFSRLKSILSIGSLEELPRYNLPGTAELKSSVIKISECLKEIKIVEDENISLIKGELSETKNNIDRSNTFKRVSGAYYPEKNEVPSYYFDKKK